MLIVATAFAGATTHVPALLLRTLVAVVCVAAWPRRTVWVPVWAWVPPTFAWLLLLAGLPSAVSLDPALQAVSKVGFVCLAFLLAASSRENISRRAVLAFQIAGWVHAGWAIGQWILGAPRGRGGFANPNDLAALLAPLAVMGLIDLRRAIQRSSDLRIRAVLGATVAFTALGILATLSRSGLLALLFGFAVVLLFWRTRLALALILVVVVANVALPPLRSRWTGSRDAFAYTRLAIWREAVHVALDRPLGVGVGGFHEALRVRGVPIDDGVVRYPKTAHTAHCEPLHAWVELGWPGLLAAILPVALIGWLALRRRRGHGDTPTTPEILGVLVAFAVPALVSSSLGVLPVSLLAAVWAGQLVSSKHALPGPFVKLENPTKVRVAIAAVACVLLAIAIPGAVSSEAYFHAQADRDAGDLDGAWQAAHVSTRSAPWRLGPALMRASIGHLRGSPVTDTATELLELADRHPEFVRPVQLAADLLEGAATTSDWRLIVSLREEQTRRDPQNALAWVALGRAHLHHQSPGLAARAFEQARAVEPRCATALAYLAQSAHQGGDRETSNNLARAAWAAHDLAERQRGYAREVLSLTPDSLKILRALEAGP
ncbi:MAG: hypothetical protein A2289_08835 [Deltaproteobacteria bacterium RIFOXYA12_FULL_58_15]|nr:MAG: hypothetical protein A2289_08835 [Deltaproteobacteria bacterium RIFOXYA12_FULL_58_15]OGR10561.1 MAG: hypothetical protein A2341_09750 [Deltaproteobacteria bacterium RIFOXYB12_FULL_58_9]